MKPLFQDDDFAALLVSSHLRLLGYPLITDNRGSRSLSVWLYDQVAACVLAHDAAPDPRFIYANRAAQACFEYGWDEFLTLPSRLSAEAPDRAERQRLLDAVSTRGFATGYSGVRVSKTGRRFRIEDGTVWQLLGQDGRPHGQAAIFARWEPL